MWTACYESFLFWTHYRDVFGPRHRHKRQSRLSFTDNQGHKEKKKERERERDSLGVISRASTSGFSKQIQKANLHTNTHTELSLRGENLRLTMQTVLLIMVLTDLSESDTKQQIADERSAAVFTSKKKKKKKKWCPVWPSWWVCIKVHASCRQGCCAVGDTATLFRLLPSLYQPWSRSDSSSSLVEWPSLISRNSRVSAAGWNLIYFRKTSRYPLDHESHPPSKLLSWGEQSSLTLDSSHLHFFFVLRLDHWGFKVISVRPMWPLSPGFIWCLSLQVTSVKYLKFLTTVELLTRCSSNKNYWGQNKSFGLMKDLMRDFVWNMKAHVFCFCRIKRSKTLRSQPSSQILISSVLSN